MASSCCLHECKIRSKVSLSYQKVIPYFLPISCQTSHSPCYFLYSCSVTSQDPLETSPTCKMCPLETGYLPSDRSSKYNTYYQQFRELLIYFLLLDHECYAVHWRPVSKTQVFVCVERPKWKKFNLIFITKKLACAFCCYFCLVTW